MSETLTELLSGSLDAERAAYIRGFLDMARAAECHSPTGISQVTHAGVAYFARLQEYRRDMVDHAWSSLVQAESQKVFAALNGKLPIREHEHAHTHAMPPGTLGRQEG